jgi:hypothetical protein
MHNQQSPSGKDRFNDTPQSNETPALRPASTLGPAHSARVEQKLKEIEEAPGIMLSPDKTIHVKSYA